MKLVFKTIILSLVLLAFPAHSQSFLNWLFESGNECSLRKMTNNVNYYQEEIKKLEKSQGVHSGKSISIMEGPLNYAKKRITEIEASMKDTSWSNLRNYRGLPLVTFCAGLAVSTASALVAYKSKNIGIGMATPYLMIGSFVPHIILTDCHPSNA